MKKKLKKLVNILRHIYRANIYKKRAYKLREIILDISAYINYIKNRDIYMPETYIDPKYIRLMHICQNALYMARPYIWSGNIYNSYMCRATIYEFDGYVLMTKRIFE